MVAYIIRKVLGMIPMLIIISFLIFLGIEIMPGDAVDFMLPPDVMAMLNPAEIEMMKEELGLNDPFLLRYFYWLGDMLTGNFGYSMQSGAPVINSIAITLPATLELSITALLFSTVIGSVFGIVSALIKGSIGDNVISVAGMIGLAIPQFLFGLLMITCFVFNLEWLPVGGRMMPGKEEFFQRLDHLVLPSLVLGLSLTAGIMRYARSCMLDSLNKDYVKTARSKGLSECRVNLLHGLRVAMTPIVVLVGFRLPILIGGSMVIEQVFQWPGVGQLFVSAVNSQDTSIIMSIAFLIVVVVLISSILVDILTAILDPRVKLN